VTLQSRLLVISADGRVDGSPGDDGGVTMVDWQIGDVQLPGFVGWQRQHTPGPLAEIVQRARAEQ
jgi:hypothetical protein